MAQVIESPTVKRSEGGNCVAVSELNSFDLHETKFLAYFAQLRETVDTYPLRSAAVQPGRDFDWFWIPQFNAGTFYTKFGDVGVLAITYRAKVGDTTSKSFHHAEAFWQVVGESQGDNNGLYGAQILLSKNEPRVEIATFYKGRKASGAQKQTDLTVLHEFGVGQIVYQCPYLQSHRNPETFQIQWLGRGFRPYYYWNEKSQEVNLSWNKQTTRSTGL